jgi:hypothetical protein
MLKVTKLRLNWTGSNLALGKCLPLCLAILIEHLELLQSPPLEWLLVIK